jgi:hypothetical protein
MPTPLLPVSCPKCRERQNQLAGEVDLDKKRFPGARCMVCGHEFNENEYRLGLANARLEFEARRAMGLRPARR